MGRRRRRAADTVHVKEQQPRPGLRTYSLLWLLLHLVTVSAERAYPLGCTVHDASYYDYEKMVYTPTWATIRTHDDYLLTHRLGTGKFSDVFAAVDVQKQQQQLLAVEQQQRRITNQHRKNKRGDASLLDTVEKNDVVDVVEQDHPHHHDVVVDPRTLCVIKCLKPVSERKIRREVLILHRCRHLRNLARLEAIVLDHRDIGSCTSDASPVLSKKGTWDSVKNNDAAHKVPNVVNGRMPSLVLQHAGPEAEWLCHPGPLVSTSSMSNTDILKRTLAEMEDENDNASSDYLTEYEICYYLYHLLIAIDGLHAAGIMHRDIKPRNVLINRKKIRSSSKRFDPKTSSSGSGVGQQQQQPLMLIDLGLADFYIPGTSYNVRVASRHYKSPELLVGYEMYDYAIDLWGVGCIMAGLVLRREPFFRGKDNVDQLGKILAVLGSDDMLLFLLKYKVQVTPEIEKEIIKYHTLQRCNNQSNNNNNSTTSGVGTSTTTTTVQQQSSSFAGYSKRQALLECRADGCPIPSRDCMDLLLHLLVYDHEDRWTARQAMAHPYFDLVRDRIERENQSIQRYNYCRP